ncbi:MAG: hypothetical protein OEW11_11345 [Nitrospirota bacterium]|nr:hypothetical protein [Nitrospirota bacterium]
MAHTLVNLLPEPLPPAGRPRTLRARWRRALAAAGLLVLAMLVSSAPALAAEPAVGMDSCTTCHNQLPANSKMAGRHADFAGSVHDRAGVRCNACHGGDPAAAVADKAHKGVLPASDARSRVHFKAIPETCGGCHTAQKRAFLTSHHYQKLETTGKGPNCVTCHGSMATRVLAPDQVREFCITCHNPRLGVLPEKPYEAATTLTLLRQTAVLVKWAEEFAAATPEPQRAAAHAEVERAVTEMAMARGAWHTFNLEQVRSHADAATQSAIASRKPQLPGSPGGR